MNFIDNFRLADDKEDFQIVSENILNGIEFKGTNLWILIFAIFIASLGLNVNSTAVIIGAMLVSPLMGPIIGLGFGMAINDLAILKKSIFSYVFAAAVGLATSTVFFLLSPINEAHSEILARTSPNIYDVLIALFGGLAGILAIASKLKGNVIPGVAIATALMPPLCTAGYGLATLQFLFFFGALYLFLINTVFIALATLITTRVLKFPLKLLPHPKEELKAKRIVWAVVLVTLLPSIYFGYDMVQQNKFEQSANQFVEFEAFFPNNYLLKKNIDAKNKTISLTYGGQVIEEREISVLKTKLSKYHLDNTSLEIRQGFTYLNEKKDNQQTTQLSIALSEKENQVRLLQLQLDSLTSHEKINNQIFKELKTQYPNTSSFILKQAINYSEEGQHKIWIAIIQSKSQLDEKDKTKIEDWLKVRMGVSDVKIYFE